ncbi:SCO6745 family protein [Amycolatopsis thermoflava]|uniref:SCO6745 family protein n=1 Tax=Amycolatopsis thermoflava TaxID=84480 RepID=UPI003F4A8195
MRARELWVVLETLHDVTYFAPQAKAAHEAAGLRGFWRGYVGTRAAPLGAAGLGVVTAVFYGFAPSFLARSVPSIWEVVSPAEALAARSAGAVAALREHVREVPAPVLPVLRRIVAAAGWAGRPLGAANAALPWPDDPLAALWQAATTLREHRGDGHVAVLAAEGVDGLEAHALRDAADGSRSVVAPNRGWTDEEWAAARDRLAARGLIDGRGLTDHGARLREHIERRTDELAAVPYSAVGEDELAALDGWLRPIARGLVPVPVPHPNPVGAPAP